MFYGFDGNTGCLLNGEVVFGSGLVANVSKRVELDPKKKIQTRVHFQATNDKSNPLNCSRALSLSLSLSDPKLETLINFSR